MLFPGMLFCLLHKSTNFFLTVNSSKTERDKKMKFSRNLDLNLRYFHKKFHSNRRFFCVVKLARRRKKSKFRCIPKKGANSFGSFDQNSCTPCPIATRKKKISELHQEIKSFLMQPRTVRSDH